MDTTYHPESEEAMCCPICKRYATYHPSNEDQTFSCITFENHPHKEDGSEEVDQDGSEPQLLSLFPVTPDLQPFNQESVTSAPAEDTTAEEIVAQPRERVAGGLLLRIDYRPLRRLPSMIYVNESIADAMLRCQCNLCNENLARIWWLRR